ncbi:phage-related tail fiber protein [uncultured Mediterranean phage uvMED]|nr:phage-related tail fiber protein [uncultured Mediterranean phage uvMED]
MADLKISELNALAGSNLATGDLVAVVDDSASETKKLTVGDLIANGVTVISDATIPGAKILFADGGIATAKIADSAVTTAKVAAGGITAAKLANESTVDLVTTLPTSGAFTGQLALDTDDNKLYIWNGSAWLSLKGAGSVNAVTGSTVGVVDIVATTTGDSVAVSASVNNSSAANQFLAGPTSGAGAVAYRTIDGSDIPVATSSAKGGVIVNAEGLRMDSNTIEINNDVSASTTHHVVTYDAKGLITGGRVLAAADLPAATSSAKGAVIPGTGLSVDSSGNLDHTNSISTGTFTKVTVDAQGHVSTGATLAASDIPDLAASQITSGTFGASLLASDSVTAAKLANESTAKFGGAGATDNVVTFPDGDYKGQFFYDEKNEDLYIYTGTSFVPITVISGNLINAGTYNANTNQVTSVTTAGSAAGFTAGSALPTPATVNLNYYVVVDTSGTGSGAAPAVSLAPPDMLISLGAGSTFQLVDVSNAIAGQTAANISVVPAGGIAATDVQAAIQELDTEKLGAASPTFTGTVLLGQNAVLAFEGSADDAHELTITCTNPTADRTITFPNVTGNVVTTGDTGTVTSTMIADATIANADISASAEIAVSKLANGSARQLLQTASNGTDVEFTSNVDVPGTLDVTGVATFDSTSTFAGVATFNANIVMEGTSADDHELTLTCNPTADVTVTLPDATTTVAGLAVAQSFTKAQRGTPVALTDGATIAVDMSLGNNFSVTLGGNRSLGDPTNVTAGQSGVIVVTQDGTGSRTLAYAGSKYKFAGGSAVTLSTGANAVDVLAYYVESSTRITVTSLLNVS